MKRIRDKMIGFLKQGITPRDLALAVALGIVLGTFPVIGSTTLLCIAASVFLRLNLPAIQSVNWLVSPLQLMLIIPLFKMGSVLFGAGAITVNLADVIGKMNADLLGTIREYLLVTLHAICVWGLLAPLMIAIVFFVMLPLFTRLEVKYVRISADIQS
jgi:uncharacterized protein (DUF2062 family)